MCQSRRSLEQEGGVDCLAEGGGGLGADEALDVLGQPGDEVVGAVGVRAVRHVPVQLLVDRYEVVEGGGRIILVFRRVQI